MVGELSQSMLGGKKEVSRKLFADNKMEPEILLFLGHFLA